jgi:hypothetical protein
MEFICNRVEIALHVALLPQCEGMTAIILYDTKWFWLMLSNSV